ncbi:hypothetical protein GCT13_42095 [Paraburkholderia sp. CNPSo 3157]|uniref:Uncharacterized protein n=1 Tax=Paraburkholderia franconis TaxID=2654983 RepID=A0A7X1TL74_9BURK|nr:hypothetical protein [Paraburkholderia franconis]MPW23188.1 hypothetical protein [Paraburkholderia franconis]
MQTDTIIEQDIMHLGLVLRAIFFRRTADATTTPYWRNRLHTLFQSLHLSDYQRHWIQELMHELHKFERQGMRDR